MRSTEYIALGWDVARSKGYDASSFDTNSDLNALLWELWDEYEIAEKDRRQAEVILDDEISVE